MGIIQRIDLPKKKIIAKGAEATLYESVYLDYPVVCKERLPKIYRSKSIDEKLRKERTIQEVRLLQNCVNNGIPVPLILDVDKSTWTIVMEKVAGMPVKLLFGVEQISELFLKIGNYVGKFHQLDIIHGDLTTSNILVGEDNQIWFIDFGLGFISTYIEDKAVDLLVLKHTLESSHPEFAEDIFAKFKSGYDFAYNESDRIFKRLEKVETRVRYRSHSVE